MRRLAWFVPVLVLAAAAVGCSSDPDPVALNTPLTPEERQLVEQGREDRARAGYEPARATTADGVRYAVLKVRHNVGDVASSVATTVAVDAAEGWCSTFVRSRLGSGVAFVVFGLIAAVLKGSK